ncbi:Maf family protein [Paenibacillus sediminis]|uniref:dTTP/UTP pyrophosphatase n=1 Tax=Paenibacillus sediminis TaxID=664909 RepID=A0ABS4H7R6_9BACL|nr:Maf family protein [Paenibacillus sediminis]MBP1938317.1 septum formation protein [Paenibacillus sediminis]
MKPLNQLILASTSPRRQELIASLQIPFTIVPSHVDEDTPSDWTPEQVVRGLALRKAQAVFDQLKGDRPEAVIVGSDTIVELDGRILGKPKDDNEAVSMLTSLQGRTHRVFTGVACIHGVTGDTLVEHRVTSVTMKPLSHSKIVSYVKSGEPRDKAGAYAIQGLGATIVESIEGCYFNVVGLPISLLTDMLEKFGVQVL